MEKTYNPQAIEQNWYQFWESNNYFAPVAATTSYCIMIPPPNVTGVLHMGHGFQAAIQDALIRYHRMCGEETLWQPGTDHAGIATQIMVERRLSLAGQDRKAIGREAFLKHAWEWKDQSGNSITKQFRRLGISVDWNRECFTLDERLSSAVSRAFIQLYDEGLIYRGKRLVNWDPVLHTALSDLEVISEETSGTIWHIQYPLADGSGSLEIATTRPETMLGDSAVAVHPDDERYQALIGRLITLPLCHRLIPIIADTAVDPEFGTGCVKVTPAHDFTDFAIGNRHNLPQICIFDNNAILNDAVPENYRGLDRFEAREKIIADLTDLKLLIKTEPHQLAIPKGERSGVIVEPMITDQWYVKAAALAQPAMDVVKQGKIKFVPENWQSTYFHWLENIQDWCISRQLWWGHRIPAWYDDQGNIYVAENETVARNKYQLSSDVILKQDDDVLDTWFSSALWPFSTLGWPEPTEDLKTFYPTSVLVTGFDIIFFWVARMIMMGLKFMGQVPFHEVYITPLIRDSEGQKMSKSKGNALDPLDIIDGIDLESLVKKNTAGVMQASQLKKVEANTRKEYPAGIPAYGTDALRLTFCASASPGRNINFDLKRVEVNRNFCNKLWNASRFALMNLENKNITPFSPSGELSLADKWIQSRLQTVITKVHEFYQLYRFDLMCQTLYDFTWHEFCDWYLELCKPVLFSAQESGAILATRACLAHTLETLLRLLHPLMPYITEAIWQKIAPFTQQTGDTIMTQCFPQPDPALIDENTESEIHWLQQFIIGIRTIRGEMNISPAKTLPALIQNASKTDLDRLKRNDTTLKTLAKITSLTVLANETPPQSATALVGNMEILIPLAGLIDVAQESARLDKELQKINKELVVLQTKLANPTFVDKAPAEVVAKEQHRLAELTQTSKTLQEKLSALATL